MSELELHRRMVNLELSGNEGRILEGVLVPYNTPTRVQDPGGPPYMEVFEPGAFKRQLAAADKVQLRFEHRDGLTDRVGRGLEMHERDDGLFGRFRVVDGVIGDHALALVDEGMIGGFSVGFADLARLERRNEKGHVLRQRCHLADVSLVPEPAYAGTAVAHRHSPSPLAAPPPAVSEEQLARLAAIGITLPGDGTPTASA
jgi:Escherichia/Staphylococcus phage prohead protease